MRPIWRAQGVRCARSPRIDKGFAGFVSLTRESAGVRVVVAAMAIFQVKPWKEWINAAAGIWVATSPRTLGFSNQTVVMWIRS